jgi:hypothetical protein
MLDITIVYTNQNGKCLILREAYTREYAEKLPLPFLNLIFLHPFFYDIIEIFVKYPKHGMKFSLEVQNKWQ